MTGIVATRRVQLQLLVDLLPRELKFGLDCVYVDRHCHWRICCEKLESTRCYGRRCGDRAHDLCRSTPRRVKLASMARAAGKRCGAGCQPAASMERVEQRSVESAVGR